MSGLIVNTKSLGTFIWNFIDDRAIVRRAIVAFTLFLTFIAYKECFHLAEAVDIANTNAGLNIAAIIAAILTPLSTLQGFVVKFYFDMQSTSSSDTNTLISDNSLEKKP